jgi:glycosyltransferase involved in cell wall biosynthesis
MKVSGFTFIRNGNQLGYPYIESIKSALPLVDEFIVAVGDSQDDTEAHIRAIDDPKIRIIQTQWNESMRDRGYVYGQQKMVALFNCTGDWALYIEGDEVLHEDELPVIRARMEQFIDDSEVEAMHFDFYHFYGTPEQVGISGYRKAPRIIRNSVRSIAPDGLFFVVMDKNKRGRYPRSIHTGAHVYHYGHVRNVAKMRKKVMHVSRYWSKEKPSCNGYGDIDTAVLRPFKGRHPAIMNHWLATEAEHHFEQTPDYRLSKRDKKYRIKLWIEDTFNLEISKKHYKDLSKQKL